MKTVNEILESVPGKMSGAVVFRGTRIPVETFFCWLKNGETVDVFLEEFPSVSREQTDALLLAVNEESVAQVTALKAAA
jgi:uncharacterized protein (DUF433 family)